LQLRHGRWSARVNIGEPGPDLSEAEWRGHRMQEKRHQWAGTNPTRRFDDLYNLVYDPACLVVAFSRVRDNTGARSAGVDHVVPRALGIAPATFRADWQQALKARRFGPTRVREQLIPKANGKRRRLGIPTAADRTVHAAVKLVRAPIFEADFRPCSYGCRPRRRAQDAIAEIHYLGTPVRNDAWIFEAEIAACFDEIDHGALMGRVRHRVGDKRWLALLRAFLRAGMLAVEGTHRQTLPGTPQGGIRSPLLASIALSGLDQHFQAQWEALGPVWTRVKRQRAGAAAHRLIRYADDFVVMVRGTRAQAEAVYAEGTAVLAPLGLRLSAEPARVGHIDEGFDFLGGHIQRRAMRGRPGKQAVYTYPAKKALAVVMEQVRSLTRRTKHRTLARLLYALNPVWRGWCNYFRHGVSARTFSYLDHFTDAVVSPRGRSRGAVSLSRHAHPDPRGGPVGAVRPIALNLRRAGCGESRTSGSEGGARNPAGRKAARRPDLARQQWGRDGVPARRGALDRARRDEEPLPTPYLQRQSVLRGPVQDPQVSAPPPGPLAESSRGAPVVAAVFPLAPHGASVQRAGVAGAGGRPSGRGEGLAVQ